MMNVEELKAEDFKTIIFINFTSDMIFLFYTGKQVCGWFEEEDSRSESAD